MELHGPFAGGSAAVAQEFQVPARGASRRRPGGGEPARCRGAGREGLAERPEQQERAAFPAGGELQAPCLGEFR